MSEQEIYWLLKCERHKDEYVINVDNDCVFVAEIKSGECVFEFNHYGWEMVLDLLRHIGCNAEEV